MEFLPQAWPDFVRKRPNLREQPLDVTMVRKPVTFGSRRCQRASRAASALGLTLPVVVRSGRVRTGSAMHNKKLTLCCLAVMLLAGVSPC
jgi:hypothetical protein